MKKVDLFWISRELTVPSWDLGICRVINENLTNLSGQFNEMAQKSEADYILFWWSGFPLPDKGLVEKWVAEELDLVHAGLKLGVGEFWRDLFMVKQDWSMINLSVDVAGSSWRINWRAFLVRRELWLRLGGMDPVFISQDAGILDFGFRSMHAGALVEYRPEMLASPLMMRLPDPPSSDFYIFLIRTFGHIWGWYIFLRRLLRFWVVKKEYQSWRIAHKQIARFPFSGEKIFWDDSSIKKISKKNGSEVSVIIPTLGRYAYIPEALESLRNQTVPPAEVIVVDQNPIAQRQPEVYDGYEDLNLRVIWQDERGQSLARNSGIAIANSPYIFLFDDDSVANPDLIESHLQFLIGNLFHVSTGVSFPPVPHSYTLPEDFRHPRLSQTLDTGNSLLHRDILIQIGGLDRNYDLGPGTDSDLGTRLYLTGYRIIHNPNAIRIHYKAPSGGLRVHGAHKYNTDSGLFEPFPPITRSYYALRYLKPFERRELVFINYITSKYPNQLRHSKVSIVKKYKIFGTFLLGLCFLPLKVYRSQKLAQKMIDRGVRLENFANGPGK